MKKSIAGDAIVSFDGILPGFRPKSYERIAGANERILVASMGVNARGLKVARSFAGQPGCELLYVDSRAADKCTADVEKIIMVTSMAFQAAILPAVAIPVFIILNRKRMMGENKASGRMNIGLKL